MIVNQTRPRILHGPSNVAGFAGNIAKAQQALGLNAISICLPNNFGYSADYLFAQNKPPKVSFSEFFLRHYLRFDVYHFYFDRTYTGVGLHDVRWLKKIGKKVIFTFLGCDIRDSQLETSRDPSSMCSACQFNGCSPNRDALSKLIPYLDAVYVTTPDLLRSAPEAEWIGLVIDEKMVRQEIPEGAPIYQPGTTLRLYHAPTDPIKKGTTFIEAAVSDLNASGIKIELVGEARLKNTEIWKDASTCHVAVDQLLSGVYGTFSVEMMAAGIPVISYMETELWNAHGRDLDGIINASTSNFALILKQIYTGEVDLGAQSELAQARFERLHRSSDLAAKIAESYAPHLLE